MNCKRNGKFFKKLTVATILVLGLLTVYRVVDCLAHDRASRALETISNKLDLSADQKEKFEVLMNELVSAKKEIESNRQKIKTDFVESLARNDINQENLAQLASTVKEQVDVMMAPVIKRMIAFNESLNDEQRGELAAELRKHTDRRKAVHFFSGWH